MWAHSNAIELLEAIYPAHLPLKEDALKPTVSLDIYAHDGDLCWEAHLNALGDFLTYNASVQQSVLPFVLSALPQCFKVL